MLKIFCSFMAAVLLLGISHAHAITYNLNSWNYNTANADYGTVTITEDATGRISFVIAAGTFFTSNAANTRLTFDEFDFNYNGSVSLAYSQFNFGSTPGSWSVAPGGNSSSFGVFSDQSNGTGIGNDTINPLSFYYIGTPDDGISVDDFIDYSTMHTEFSGYYFAAHLRRIDAPTYLSDGNEEDGSVWLASTEPNGTPVPEPGSSMLLGIGMFCLAVYGKRRMINKE